MPNAWYQRLYLVLAVVIGSIYLLIPTFFWHPPETGTTAVASATPEDRTPRLVGTANSNGSLVTPAVATSSSLAAQSSEEAMPGWMSVFPKKKLRLGLDLVGGSHLGLGVDTEEALRAIASGHRRDVKDRLTKEGIAFSSVNQPLGTSRLEIALKNATDRAEVTTLVTTKIDNRLEEAGTRTDEAGNTVVTYGFKPDSVEQIQDQAVTQVLELLRGRVNTFGVSEPIIFREKSDRIVVELPGLKNPEEAINNIKRTARLEFHIVDEDYYRAHGGEGPTEAQLNAMAQQVLARNPNADDQAINIALQGGLPEDDAIYFERAPSDIHGARARLRPYLLKREIALTGDKLQDANPVTDKFNKWEVQLRFQPDGADIFERLTGENVGKRMAVVLEGNVETAPVINDKISGGDAVITLGGTRDPQTQARDASNIARVLKTGALPAPVRIEQNRTVGPSLGQDSIRRGIGATALGFGLVFVFAWVWYHWSGFIATIALAANAVVVLALMTFFDATLTLPGIAGIVLTTGMAVDANVLIYERIREELRGGKSVRVAVEAGFEHAFWTVIDSHVTTAMGGVVLYVYGTDQIKGFAVTLLLGIACSLFTALVISRLCFDYWTMKLKPQTLSI